MFWFSYRSLRYLAVLPLPLLHILHPQLGVRLLGRPGRDVELDPRAGQPVQRDLGSPPAALEEVGRRVRVGAGVLRLT